MADKAAPAWEILGQAEDYAQVGGQGPFVQGIVVTFKTASGVQGSVFVPREQYALERVRELVNAQASTAEAIAGLTG